MCLITCHCYNELLPVVRESIVGLMFSFHTEVAVDKPADNKSFNCFPASNLVVSSDNVILATQAMKGFVHKPVLIKQDRATVCINIFEACCLSSVSWFVKIGYSINVALAPKTPR